jgi:murein DD-endopeptidase MepM/ murein hydrolase activator NlpD
MHALKQSLLLCFLPVLLLSSGCTPQKKTSLPENLMKTIVLETGDTLGESLQQVNLPPAARTEIVQQLGKAFDLRRCRSGDKYEVLIDSALDWTRFSYYPPGLAYYTLEKSTAGITTEKKARSASRTILTARGSIRSSLWESMTSRQMPPELVVKFAEIFAWQFDFLTDCRAGDTFKVVYEQYAADNGTIISTEILAAQYIASGEDYTAILYTMENGQKGYFTPDGKSMKSAFLKAPLQFRRISSFFTRKRFHPVLKRYRPHLGIDYAAPGGTPVSSIGDGTVIYAGRKGGFGNYVGVRHANGYCSYYGHLSRYGKGIRSGARVHQGQVIGFVGSTGLSTGPHLDFRVTRNGSFINFLSIRTPAAVILTGREKNSFNGLKKTLYTRLASIV